MCKYVISLALLTLVGCADLNTNAFRAEKLAADTGGSSVHSFNAYYNVATNGASAKTIDELNKTQDQVFDASRKLSAVLSVTEAARLAYSTNSSPANEAVLRSALSSLGSNAGNVTGTVANAMAPYSTLTK